MAAALNLEAVRKAGLIMMYRVDGRVDRELVPIKHGEIEVSPAQVAALAAMPLSGLDLSKYLQKAPADSSITLRDFDADFPLSRSARPLSRQPGPVANTVLGLLGFRVFRVLPFPAEQRLFDLAGSSPYANNKRALKMMERLKVDVGFDTAKRQAAQPPVLKVTTCP